jgi:hypothetical protein
VRTQRNLDLTGPLQSGLQSLFTRALRSDDRKTSQELAAMWMRAGVESVIFPSATGIGRNVVIYLSNAGADSVLVVNRAAVLVALTRPNQ